MTFRLRFACQHQTLVVEDVGEAPPVCPVCGERRIQSVVSDRAPRFRGAVLGPCATADPSRTAIVVQVAPAGPLALKESI